MSRTVFTGHYGVIYAGGPVGEDARALTPADAVCTWPSWSPDGAVIAFSRFQSGGNGRGLLGLYLARPEGSTPELVYTNEIGTDAIANGTPHYVLWSPDGRRLAFIAQTLRGGLGLFVHQIAGSDPPKRLLEGGPMYMSWSFDSRLLVAHSRRDYYFVDFEGAAAVRQMPGTSSLYMAPSWCPAVNRVALFQDAGGGRQRLLLADTDQGTAQTLAEVGGHAAVAWSPGGRTLGLLRDLQDASGYYDGLWLLEADGSGERRITDDRVLCFFWSPGGRRIAYVTPSEGAEGSVRWAVLEVEGGDRRYLADFRPTWEQLTAFMFFDQYGQSHSPWSLDGMRLIFVGALGREAVRTVLPEGMAAGVFVSV